MTRSFAGNSQNECFVDKSSLQNILACSIDENQSSGIQLINQLQSMAISVIDWYRAINDQSIVKTKFCRRHRLPSIGTHIGCSQTLPVESFGRFRSVVTGSQVVSHKNLKSTWWYTIVSRVIPPSQLVSLSQAGEHTRQTRLSTKLQEWCCEYPSLMGSCRPSNYLHSTPPRQHTVAYEIEAAWSSVFQNRFQSMTIDGVHFIDRNR